MREVAVAISRPKFRQLALRVLDNSDGIDKDTMACLDRLLVESMNDDLLEYVVFVDGRFFISETVAEKELAKLGVENG